MWTMSRKMSPCCTTTGNYSSNRRRPIISPESRRHIEQITTFILLTLCGRVFASADTRNVSTSYSINYVTRNAVGSIKWNSLPSRKTATSLNLRSATDALARDISRRPRPPSHRIFVLVSTNGQQHRAAIPDTRSRRKKVKRARYNYIIHTATHFIVR